MDAPVKTGRKPLNIDWSRVDKMLEAHCTAVSIADVLGVSESALRKRCEIDKKTRFSEYAQLKRERGDDLLRDKQHEVAMSGDKVMLVWLGKNRLGQSDKKEITTISDRDTMVKKVIVGLLAEGHTPERAQYLAEYQVDKMQDFGTAG